MYLKMDRFIDDGVEKPDDPLATGSSESLVAWDSLGRHGKNFVVGGPTQGDLSEFHGGPAVRPLRVYVGLGSAETPQHRAKLALRELKRVGGFDRSVLIVATPTGTGWLAPPLSTHLSTCTLATRRSSACRTRTSLVLSPSWSIRIARVMRRSPCSTRSTAIGRPCLRTSGRDFICRGSASVHSVRNRASNWSPFSKIPSRARCGVGRRSRASAGLRSPRIATPAHRHGYRDFETAAWCGSPGARTR